MSHIRFQDILGNPVENIPNLPERAIRLIIIEVIIAYLERKITLKTVAEVATLIKKYKAGPLPFELESDLDELSAMYVEEEVLTDILVDLARANS